LNRNLHIVFPLNGSKRRCGEGLDHIHNIFSALHWIDKKECRRGSWDGTTQCILRRRALRIKRKTDAQEKKAIEHANTHFFESMAIFKKKLPANSMIDYAGL
jgi:hypothetical protein